MTGMDVLRRCRQYQGNMDQLQLKLDMAKDLVTRATRSADTLGHGTGGDKMGEYMARVDLIDRQMQERREMYRAEVETAVQMLGQLSPEQGYVMMMRYIEGMTVRQIAGARHLTEDGVRGLIRRGRETMGKMECTMDAAYCKSQKAYRGE